MNQIFTRRIVYYLLIYRIAIGDDDLNPDHRRKLMMIKAKKRFKSRQSVSDRTTGHR